MKEVDSLCGRKRSEIRCLSCTLYQPPHFCERYLPRHWNPQGPVTKTCILSVAGSNRNAWVTRSVPRIEGQRSSLPSRLEGPCCTTTLSLAQSQHLCYFHHSDAMQEGEKPGPRICGIKPTEVRSGIPQSLSGYLLNFSSLRIFENTSSIH